MPSLLFVCAANMCRSPMASALMRRRVERLTSTDDWRIASAGIWAQEGAPAIGEAQAVLREMHLDLGKHRSRNVLQVEVRSFDLVLVMETNQKEALRVTFPDIAERIYLLSEMAGSPLDIPDPVGGTLADVRNTAQTIDRYLSQGFARILQLTQHQQDSP